MRDILENIKLNVESPTCEIGDRKFVNFNCISILDEFLVFTTYLKTKFFSRAMVCHLQDFYVGH